LERPNQPDKEQPYISVSGYPLAKYQNIRASENLFNTSLPDKPDKPSRPERPDRPNKPEKPDRPDTPNRRDKTD
jgi:hypothetical protein